MRSLSEILATPDEWTKRVLAAGEQICLQAVEMEMLVHSIYYGMRLRRRSTKDEDIPSFEIDNYPCSEQQKASLTATLRKEIAAGFITFVDEKPRWLSPIHGKDETKPGGPEKIRLLRDFSASQQGRRSMISQTLSTSI